MLKLRDFECEDCNIINEHLAEDEEDVPCPLCGNPMIRKISWNYHGTVKVDMIKEYKRREKKGDRVRAMVKKQVDSFK